MRNEHFLLLVKRHGVVELPPVLEDERPGGRSFAASRLCCRALRDAPVRAARSRKPRRAHRSGRQLQILRKRAHSRAHSNRLSRGTEPPVSPRVGISESPANELARFWPQWRGPTANGVSPSGNPPTEWSETKNVHWKIAMPGAGSSTPVLWGNRLYVTTAVPFGARQTSAAQRQPRRNWGPPPNPDASRRHRFLVLAIDRSTGETVWETSVREELPHAGTHEFGNFATPLRGYPESS